MKSGIKTFYLSLATVVSIVLFSSCDDPELDALMADYCDCISASRYETGKHIECIEKMDSIKSMYKDQPRKILKVIEKTDECY
ncbi:hypothetical protein ERX46_02625 [Brumimicrobium glaciale]|uniref:Lipoprotein n=1 Tax=Brumimicrobium glaciale TaxID=200475 RepID=A0A4Q4KS86_9FLAO|nr:hypothetical protein [Brumimicrobium glaciale]RYM35905.1 hypothetical protein ERX46_02625 [Brumimicrobium glaciale]